MLRHPHPAPKPRSQFCPLRPEGDHLCTFGPRGLQAMSMPPCCPPSQGWTSQATSHFCQVEVSSTLPIWIASLMFSGVWAILVDKMTEH